MAWDWKQIKVASLSAALPSFQIYHPWIDHGSHQRRPILQSYHSTGKWKQNSRVQREAGSVSDECCSVHSYNPVSHVHGFNLQLYRQGLKMRIFFMCLFFASVQINSVLSLVSLFSNIWNPGFILLPSPVTGSQTLHGETSGIAPFQRMWNTEEYQPSKINLKLIISSILKPVPQCLTWSQYILREDIFGKLQINGTNKEVEELTQCTETRNRSTQVHSERENTMRRATLNSSVSHGLHRVEGDICTFVKFDRYINVFFFFVFCMSNSQIELHKIEDRHLISVSVITQLQITTFWLGWYDINVLCAVCWFHLMCLFTRSSFKNARRGLCLSWEQLI